MHIQDNLNITKRMYNNKFVHPDVIVTEMKGLELWHDVNLKSNEEKGKLFVAAGNEHLVMMSSKFNSFKVINICGAFQYYHAGYNKCLRNKAGWFNLGYRYKP